MQPTIELGKRAMPQMTKAASSGKTSPRAADNKSEEKDPYEFYKRVGSPKFFVAPMVDQSELPYRMLTRKYGAQICYTPMYHARLFST